MQVKMATSSTNETGGFKRFSGGTWERSETLENMVPVEDDHHDSSHERGQRAFMYSILNRAALTAV